jgi:hypothetical protein
MAKLRQGVRKPLGYVTGEKGAQVEVKNPTIWRTLVGQEQRTQQQEQQIQTLQKLLNVTMADRDRLKKAFDQVSGNRYVKLGVAARLVKLDLDELDVSAASEGPRPAA